MAELSMGMSLGIENVSGMRRQIRFEIGFLRCLTTTIRPVPTTSTSRPRRSAASACALATPSKVDPSPKSGERYFALLASRRSTARPPERRREKILFDNLTPLYPNKRLRWSTTPGKLPTRIIDAVAHRQRASAA